MLKHVEIFSIQFLAVGLILACVVAACEIWSFIRSGKSYPPKAREISKTNSVADADRLRADEVIRVRYI